MSACRPPPEEMDARFTLGALAVAGVLLSFHILVHGKEPGKQGHPVGSGRKQGKPEDTGVPADQSASDGPPSTAKGKTSAGEADGRS